MTFIYSLRRLTTSKWSLDGVRKRRFMATHHCLLLRRPDWSIAQVLGPHKAGPNTRVVCGQEVPLADLKRCRVETPGRERGCTWPRSLCRGPRLALFYDPLWQGGSWLSSEWRHSDIRALCNRRGEFRRIEESGEEGGPVGCVGTFK